MRPIGRFLDRFRRAAGVPAVAADDLSTELAPVFAALEEIEAEAVTLKERAAAQAAARLAAAHETSEHIEEAARARAEAARAEAFEARLHAAEDEARAMVDAARAEAERVRTRGARRLQPLVDAVIAGVLEESR